MIAISILLALVTLVLFSAFVLLMPRRLLSVLRSDDFVAPENGDHDPDLAFIQPLSVSKVAVAASLLAVGLTLVLYLANRAVAVADLTLRMKVIPSQLVEFGLDASESRRLRDYLEGDTDEDDGISDRFIRQVTSSKHADAATEVNRALLATYVDTEKDANALTALSALLVGLANPEESRDTPRDEHEKRVREFLHHELLPRTLDAPSFDVLLKRLRFHSEVAQIQKGLETAFTGGQLGAKELVAGLYEIARDEILAYRRVHRLFIGWIQAATYVLFFFALLLLRARKDALDSQRRFDSKLKDLQDIDKGLATLIATRPAARENRFDDLIFRLEDDSVDTLTRELEITKAVGLNRGESHLYGVGLLLRVLREYEAAAKAKSDPTRADTVLRSITDRTDRRLSRAEYALIDFAVWAMPSLGFIGTVIGIGLALGSADEVVKATDALSQASAISAVTGILGLAFDTTLIALLLSIPVVFVDQVIRAREHDFLIDTERRVSTRILHWQTAQ